MGAMLSRIERDVVAAHPDLVVWQVGTNDVLHDDDAAAGAAILRQGVQWLKSAGIAVLPLGIPTPPPKLAPRGAPRMAPASPAGSPSRGRARLSPPPGP